MDISERCGNALTLGLGINHLPAAEFRDIYPTLAAISKTFKVGYLRTRAFSGYLNRGPW